MGSETNGVGVWCERLGKRSRRKSGEQRSNAKQTKRRPNFHRATF
jgi:hypothetical protein